MHACAKYTRWICPEQFQVTCECVLVNFPALKKQGGPELALDGCAVIDRVGDDSLLDL